MGELVQINARQKPRTAPPAPASAGEVVKFPNLYRLRQNEKTLKVGTLTQVWNFTKETLGDMHAVVFKAKGYSIERAGVPTHG